MPAVKNVGERRGRVLARCPSGSFSSTPLPNPAGPFPITGLSSDYPVFDAVGLL